MPAYEKFNNTSIRYGGYPKPTFFSEDMKANNMFAPVQERFDIKLENATEPRPDLRYFE